MISIDIQYIQPHFPKWIPLFTWLPRKFSIRQLLIVIKKLLQFQAIVLTVLAGVTLWFYFLSENFIVGALLIPILWVIVSIKLYSKITSNSKHLKNS